MTVKREHKPNLTLEMINNLIVKTEASIFEFKNAQERMKEDYEQATAMYLEQKEKWDKFQQIIDLDEATLNNLIAQKTDEGVVKVYKSISNATVNKKPRLPWSTSVVDILEQAQRPMTPLDIVNSLISQNPDTYGKRLRNNTDIQKSKHYIKVLGNLKNQVFTYLKGNDKIVLNDWIGEDNVLLVKYLQKLINN